MIRSDVEMSQTHNTTRTVGKVSTDKSVQNFSRYWVVLSTYSIDAF